MGNSQEVFRGAMLGMAVGDAMGNAIDRRSLSEICEDYGPNGLLGYDLVNDLAEVTSYTQLAAFACNGLLLATSRDKYDKLPRYLAMSLREWAKSQQFRGNATEKTYCWLAQVPQMRRRQCMDTRMLDALGREALGTPEKPVIRSQTPAALTAAVAAGILYDPEKMTKEELIRLGAHAVAFTHGDPESWLSGAVLAYIIAGILQVPEKRLQEQITEAVRAVGEQYPCGEAEALAAMLQQAADYAADVELTPLAALSILGCTTARECLAGALYASMIHPSNFDEGMIAAVNHSGRSCAVAAVTGAILGAKLGAEELPEFYLESLEQGELLAELATDVVQGRQLSRIFDADWDQKYTHGLPAV